jgi:hypothetical protein
LRGRPSREPPEDHPVSVVKIVGKMDGDEVVKVMVVRRCAERGQAELYSLVLSAKGIEAVIDRDADGFALLVTAEDAGQAEDELTAYDSENRGQTSESKCGSLAPPPLPPRSPPATSASGRRILSHRVVAVNLDALGHEGSKAPRFVIIEVQVPGDALMAGDADGEPAGASGENRLALHQGAEGIGSGELRHPANKEHGRAVPY